MFSVKNASLRWYFDLEHERVVLGAVVGVVERRRHRILVGRVGLAVRVRRQQRRRTRPCRRGTSCSRRSPDRRERRAGARRAPMPSGRSVSITRIDGVAVLAELGVGLELGDRSRRPARRSRTTPARWSAKSSGPSGVPSGLVPNCSAAAASAAGSTAAQRDGREDRAGPRRGALPPRGCRAAAAAAAGVAQSRRAGCAEMTTGVDAGAGCRRRRTSGGPSTARRRRSAAPRPRPPRRPAHRCSWCVGSAFSVVSSNTQRALVAGAARGEIAAREEPAWPGRQRSCERVAAGPRLGDRRLAIGCGAGSFCQRSTVVARRIAGVRLVDDRPRCARRTGR